MLPALRSKVVVSFVSLIFLSWNANAQTYVFVSYSMPDHALKSYHTQAQKEGGTLVMRGLKDDSFMETQKEARRLKITYDINPDLFEEYAITRVPTIVVETSDASQKCAVFSQVMGHVSLKTAQEVIGGSKEDVA